MDVHTILGFLETLTSVHFLQITPFSCPCGHKHVEIWKQWPYSTAPLLHTRRHKDTETYAHARVYVNSVLNPIDIEAK